MSRRSLRAARAALIPLLLAAVVTAVGLWTDAVLRRVVERRVHDQLRVVLDRLTASGSSAELKDAERTRIARKPGA